MGEILCVRERNYTACQCGLVGAPRRAGITARRNMDDRERMTEMTHQNTAISHHFFGNMEHNHIRVLAGIVMGCVDNGK